MRNAVTISQEFARTMFPWSIVMLTVSLAIPSFGQISTPPVVADYPRDGVQLGTAWFSTTGMKQEAGNVCIEFSTHNDPAQNKDVEIKSVSDKASLMQRLDVSADLQVKAVVASASAKTSFVNSVDFQSESSTFAVRAVVQNGVESVIPGANSPIHLKQPYLDLAKNRPDEFFRECGDSFVAARYGGAELWGLISFSHVATEETEELKVQVQGSGWNIFSASGSTDSEMKKASDQKTLTIQYAESGGAGDPIPTDQAGLIAAVQSLPRLAQSAPDYTQIELVGYDSLNDWPGGNASQTHTDFQKIASRFEQLTALRDEIHHIEATPDDYILGDGVTLDSLDALDQQMWEHVKRLDDSAKTCVSSGFARCTIDPRDDITDYAFRAKMPVPKHSFLEDQEIWNLTTNLIPAIRHNQSIPGGSPQFYALGRTMLQNFNEDLIHAQAEYPAALRRAIAAKWISSAVHDRCDADAGSEDCISPAQEDAITAQIIIQYTPVPAP
jgi:hypothetical protein